jgi:hypothetical protein
MALHLMQQLKALNTTIARNARKTLKAPVLVEDVLVAISVVLLSLLLTTLVGMYISYN